MQENTIQSLGGKARNKALTAEQKSEIGKKAIAARWANRPPRATHRGNFSDKFGIDVECYVLDDAQKTAVISQSGMGKALGLSQRGNAFPRFLESRAMAEFIGAELRDKLTQALKFQWGSPGAGKPALYHGFDVTILIDVCHAILEAESKLTPQQKHIAKQAHIILNASAKSGIKGLVYALAGYTPGADEVIAAFKLYVQEEAKKYDKEFPTELYRQWFRLYNITPIQGRGWPWEFKHLTERHIYDPLAKSNGKLLALLRAVKAKGGDRKTKLFQFLNEVGARALRFQLGRVFEMAESSASKEDYEKKIENRFGDKKQETELDLFA